MTATRKADGKRVAIKRVKKLSVKRWGEIEGHIVPIEFELLNKASGHPSKSTVTISQRYPAKLNRPIRDFDAQLPSNVAKLREISSLVPRRLAKIRSLKIFTTVYNCT